VSELLPRPLRLLLGATSMGVSDRRLRPAVEHKTVLITGASSGVGEATARRLAAGGATVLLVARRVGELERVRDEIAAAGGAAHVHPCDLGDTAQVERLVSEVLAQHGHIDVLVSNAGISIRRWISQSYGRFDDIERTIHVNYLGPVRLVLGLLESMRERGGGQIVNVGTVGVNFPPLRWSAYIASKAAFETWLSGVAPEVRADGVATTSIQLQLVRSPMLGPFRIWNYLPGMSTDEAAGIVARAIVERPRTISPLWGRATGAATAFARAPIEAALSRSIRARQLARPRNRTMPQPVRVADEAARGLATIAATRVIRPVRPDRLARVALAQRRYGPTAAFLVSAAAELYPGRTAVIDELGQLGYAALDSDVRALASSLHAHFDLAAGRRVAVMCRNHRGFVQAVAAATRLGCDLVPLNSDFAAPQLADVRAREQVSTAVYDEEFDPVFEDAEFMGTRVIAWHEGDQGHPTLTALISAASGDAPPPARHGRLIALTSGTTGTPKGATRSVRARSLAPLAVAGLLDLARLKPAPRSGEPIIVAPPLFHLFGMIGFGAGFGMGSALVLRRRFDPEAVLEQIDRTRAGMLLAVPTMLKRIMDLPESTRSRYDTSSLRMIISGAAPLPPELAVAVMDQFGDVLFNGYASTEVGSGTLATPADLRAAPGTVGRPMAGVKLRILDEEGLELPQGETGRIFVGSPLLFEGYTGGGSKELIGGLMSTGDVGHFDPHGRLFIDGRDDDMILSGGENVFPQEVEELLIAHDDVADAAVFGVPDPDFGQRLAALVVRKPDAAVGDEELKQYVRQRLARHKVPRDIEFVERIPRTSTGKIQRRLLSDQYAAG
jgi:acyl-CoA synthetase (AMP-forming)/AMP-acid ligase II/short-subunit dehydrogenase